MQIAENFVLSNGARIPALGFGTQELTAGSVERAAGLALKAGYRGFGLAAGQESEAGVGAAIRSAGLSDEVFVSLKVPGGSPDARRIIQDSLRELGRTHLDLVLLGYTRGCLPTWRALERAHADGLVRTLGVADFPLGALNHFLDETEVAPAVHQVELHPWRPQPDLQELHRARGLVTEAASPLGHGPLGTVDPLRGLAGKYGKSPVQVLLRWQVQQGNVVLVKPAPRALSVERIEVFDFELAEDDMAALGELPRPRR